MYESHFRLHRRPFSPAADISCYVGIGPMEEARQTLVRSVGRASGPAVVIGGAGTGKTMLCQVIAEQFHQQMRVAVLANGRLGSPRALYQAILFGLGLPYREMDENELRLSLVDYLSDVERCPGGMLLIIDEAHVFPLRLLEEVRMLTNLVQSGKSQVQLVMAGGPTLEERFTSPKLESFNQRIAARCYLESLNREQTSAFIQEQLAMASAPNAALFSGEAIRAVYDATDGIPRLVNQLCDHALVMAAVGRHRAVDAAIVQEAWSDLQQLPTPFVEPSAKARPILSQEEVVEFGSLSDEQNDATPASIPFPQRSEQPATEVAVEEELVDLDPERQLAEIEQQVAAVSDSELDDDVAHNEPSVASPQWEVVASTSDPFAEAFDEEEEIVDGYASLQESFFASAPRVKSREGREFAALLAQAEADQTPDEFVDVEAHVTEQPAQKAAASVDYTEGQRRQQELTEAVAALLPQHDSDDGESEYDSGDADEAPAAIQMRLTDHDDPRGVDPQGDDRDVIIVQEDDEDAPPAPPMNQPAKRQKYRQLFARLRQA